MPHDSYVTNRWAAFTLAELKEIDNALYYTSRVIDGDLKEVLNKQVSDARKLRQGQVGP